jgi:CDP-glucose 4,6-dehydratase
VGPDPEFWRGRRVWLTGHTGFKGSWLSLWLQTLGAQVHGFSAGPPSDPALYEVADVADGMAGDVRGDVRSRGEVRAAVARAAPDVAIHLAAQPIVRLAYRKPVETVAINVTGTAKVLDALRTEAAPRAVLVITSDKCYRNEEHGRPFREDDPLGGDDPYSASKAAQEHLGAAFRALGLPLATARAGNVIGGGDWAVDRLVPDAMRAALAGRPLEVRAPDAIRPWQHVLNPLLGYLLLCERVLADPGARRAWNFGPDPDDARPVGWVVERLAARWPEPLEVRLAARADAAAGEAAVVRLDSTLARESLGWAPRWDLASGLDATVCWYKAFRDGEVMRDVCLRQIAAFERVAA